MRWGQQENHASQTNSHLSQDQLGENRGQMRTTRQEEPTGRGVQMARPCRSYAQPSEEGEARL